MAQEQRLANGELIPKGSVVTWSDNAVKVVWPDGKKRRFNSRDWEQKALPKPSLSSLANLTSKEQKVIRYLARDNGKIIVNGEQIPFNRLPQDINVKPTPPSPLNGSGRTIGKSKSQNQIMQDDVAYLRSMGAKDIRINQQQVNNQMCRVGICRPDVQATLRDSNKRIYIEYDRASSNRGAGHASRALSNDPDAIVILRTVDQIMNVNKDFFLAKDGHPSLKQFYFIGAPFEKALDLYLKRLMDLSDFYQNLKPKLSYLDEEYTLSQKLDFLNPLEITGSSKYLLLETQSDWSLLIDNNRNGTDFSSVPYEALLWKIRLLTMYLRPYFGKDEFGAVSFTLYEGSKQVSRHDCETRNVMLHKETSRVEFIEYGTPLPFEQTEKYTERLKKNRLTVEMIEEYCKHLGISLFDLDFYQSKAALIEILRNK